MPQPVNIRLITKEQVESLVTPVEVVDAVVDCFRALGEGKLVHPAKDPLWTNEAKTNMLLAMPAYRRDIRVAGVKWVSMYEDQKPGVPSSWGNLLILNDGETGVPYAVMDATAITTMRTAGGHGVAAARYLARKDSKTLAVIGCGEEGQAGIRSFLDNFPGLEELRLCDLNPERIREVQARFGARARVVPCENARAAVEEADIVLLVTTSRKPLVKAEWLPRGCFVAGLYAFHDLDPEVSRRADKWVLGNRTSDVHFVINDPLFAEYGLRYEQVYADLGEIVTGKRPGRESDEEIILFSHMGMGSLDLTVGELVYRRAVEKQVGTQFCMAR